MHETFFDVQKRRIESDLTSFADPGGVQVGAGKRSFSAEWVMRGEPREATFTLSRDHGVRVKINGATQPYAVFLADTRMADLKQMARMIRQAGRKEIFVPTGAKRTDTHPENTGPATELLTGLLEQPEADATQIVMVTGDAGAGKTRVLQELVLQQAGRYLHGQTEKLLLYVNAQGRALARLHEALATELQDLRVNLTYHSVATLTRVGLLVPVIDGFDELLGVSGYDDAFNSLSTFLEQLEGDGLLVASARSVYYEEEFLSRASRASTMGSQAWSHVPVKILPWEDRDRRMFLDALAERESLPQEERETLEERISRVFQENEELASKPLFFAKTVDLLRKDVEFSGGDDLLGTLTHRFLEREQQEKLLDRQQQPLLSEPRLEQLMRELAEEMWNQETRELDHRSVREVAEYILEDMEVPESARQIIVERMPTLAFLAPSERHGNILFEHEVFFFHFLARAITNQYVQGAGMRVILSRSALPEFVAERVAFHLQQDGLLSSPDGAQEVLDRLSKAGSTQWRRTTQVRENAGLIALALLREVAGGNGAGSEIAGCTISNVIFRGSHLRDVTLRNCVLVNVSIRRTDLASTKFIQCNAHDVLLEEPRIKIGSTRLELNGLRVPDEVVGVQELSEEGNRIFYRPRDLTRILRECGAPVELTAGDQRDVPDELLSLLDRLMRAYQRTNPVCDGDQNLQRLFGDPRWPVLRKLLVTHGIVKQEPRATSGRPKEFLRRQFLPAEIMSGASRRDSIEPQIARFWDSLEAVEG